MPLLASTFLFFPLLQAYLQREFEVVVHVRARRGAAVVAPERSARPAAALLAYAAWFKYIPLMFAGYLVLRRWWRELGDVRRGVGRDPARCPSGSSDCRGSSTTTCPAMPRRCSCCGATALATMRPATVRHRLLRRLVRQRIDAVQPASWPVHDGPPHRWVNPPLIYLALCAAIAAIYLRTHFRLERRRSAPALEARRRALEFSIITTICACFFFSHYYYLIVLVIPFNVLFMLYSGRSALAARWRCGRSPISSSPRSSCRSTF